MSLRTWWNDLTTYESPDFLTTMAHLSAHDLAMVHHGRIAAAERPEAMRRALQAEQIEIQKHRLLTQQETRFPYAGGGPQQDPVAAASQGVAITGMQQVDFSGAAISWSQLTTAQQQAEQALPPHDRAQAILARDGRREMTPEQLDQVTQQARTHLEQSARVWMAHARENDSGYRRAPGASLWESIMVPPHLAETVERLAQQDGQGKTPAQQLRARHQASGLAPEVRGPRQGYGY